MATHPLSGAKAGWVVYAAVLTFGVLAGEAANLSRGGEVTALTLGNWTLSAALLTALWGYALQRRIGNERYWRAVFWLVLFANSVMLIPVLLGDRRRCDVHRGADVADRSGVPRRLPLRVSQPRPLDEWGWVGPDDCPARNRVNSRFCWREQASVCARFIVSRGSAASIRVACSVAAQFGDRWSSLGWYDQDVKFSTCCSR